MSTIVGLMTDELVFIGGTGRSGTHILSYLLDRHSRYHGVPIECRFHCNPKGLADVVQGRTEPEEFLRKLRGYWWHRVRIGDRAYVRAKWRALGRGQERGLSTIVDTEPFEAAADRFEATYNDDLVAASRTLFYDLLQPLADRAGKPVLVEMSCFTIAAADGLARIFPEAKFVHSVRDGRDSGSSKVSLRQKPHHPTDVSSGITFWADRLRQAEEGVRGLSDADRERLARDQPRRARLQQPRWLLRRAVRVPRHRRRAGDARVLRHGDELRRGSPRALAQGTDRLGAGRDRRASTRPSSLASRPRIITAPRSCGVHMSANEPSRLDFGGHVQPNLEALLEETQVLISRTKKGFDAGRKVKRRFHRILRTRTRAPNWRVI